MPPASVAGVTCHLENRKEKSCLQPQNQSADLVAFVAQVERDFAKAFRVLKDTRTLSATYTFQAYVRVPGEAKVVAVHAPDAWADDQQIKAVIAGFDGTVHRGAPNSGGQGKRYGDVFKVNPDVDVLIHVHGPYLGAWAGAHRVLPLLYAPAQRHTLAREIPVYIDRRGGESAFINDTIRQNANTPAIWKPTAGPRSGEKISSTCPSTFSFWKKQRISKASRKCWGAASRSVPACWSSNGEWGTSIAARSRKPRELCCAQGVAGDGQ